MATYNEYEDKETLIENPSIPDINKVKADDMNYIKYNLPHISNEVDEDYRVNFLKSNNLLPRMGTNTIAGLTATEQSDGSLILNGTVANSNFSYYYCGDDTNYRHFNTFENGGTFTLSCNEATGYYIYVMSGGSVIASLTNGGTTTFTVQAGQTYRIFIRVSIGTTLNNVHIYPMLNEGSEELEYEPYITPSIYVDNEEIYSKEEVLFSGNQSLSTSSTTLTLNKNITDYNLIEIYYTKYSGSDSILSSLKIVPINNGYISPQIMFKATSNIIQQFWCLLKITTNAITLQDIGYVNYKISDNSVEVANNTGSFSIVKVIGYK